MPIANCAQDDDNALAFLHRAIPLLIALSPFQGKHLHLLDDLVAHPEGWGLKDRVPELHALAAEWAGPYTSEGVGGDDPSPSTVRECVLAMLGADTTTGELDFGFRTYAPEQTDSWNLGATPAAGARCFGLYLIREGERTYCCSMSPDSWAINLQNIVCLPSTDAGTQGSYDRTAGEAYREDQGLEHESLDDCYFGYLGDSAELDARMASKRDVSARESFTVRVGDVDLTSLAGHAGSPGDPYNADAFCDPETLAAAFYKGAAETAWENAREYFQGNLVEPDCIPGDHTFEPVAAAA